MTPKELKRLSRSDLLEMLLDLSKENDRLYKENETLRAKLEDRSITISSCGSIAEAALQLNGIFMAAQAACDQYAENIQQRSEHIEEYCRSMEQQTREKCEAMLAQAKAEIQSYRDEAEQKRNDQAEAYSWLTDLMEGSDIQ